MNAVFDVVFTVVFAAKRQRVADAEWRRAQPSKERSAAHMAVAARRIPEWPPVEWAEAMEET